VDGGKEVSCCFVVASGDGAEELEFGEEVLDEVPRFVEFLVILSLYFSICFGRDDCLFSGLFQGIQNPFIGVEAFIADHGSGFDSRQEHIGSVQLAGLAFGEMKIGRVAECIDGSMNLGA
jgi:hypothetical protein